MYLHVSSMVVLHSFDAIVEFALAASYNSQSFPQEPSPDLLPPVHSCACHFAIGKLVRQHCCCCDEDAPKPRWRTIIRGTKSERSTNVYVPLNSRRRKTRQRIFHWGFGAQRGGIVMRVGLACDNSGRWSIYCTTACPTPLAKKCHPWA